MKKIIRRLLVALMAFAITAPTLFASTTIRADEVDDLWQLDDEEFEYVYFEDGIFYNDDGGGVTQDTPPADPDGGALLGTPICGPTVDIALNPTSASFSTVTKGTTSSVVITVTNQGTVGVNVSWFDVQNDPGEFFTVSAPASNYLEVGQKNEYTLLLKTDIASGIYSGSLGFQATDASGNMDSEAVGLSATVKEPAPTPVVESVTVSPKDATVNKGGYYQFGASVKGTDLPTTDVTWTVRGASGAGTAINNGLLTVDPNEESTSLGVRATSVADSNVYDEVTVTVKSDPKTHNVSVVAGEGGSVSGGGTVKEGDSITIYASPSSGYEFTGWYDGAGSYISNNKAYTINNVTTDIALNAQFKRNAAYVIINSYPSDGGYTTGSGTYNVGSSANVTAKPADGYKFVGWTLNDKTISTDKSMTLTNLNGEYRLTAVFDKIKFKVSVEVAPANTGAADGSGEYERGKSANLKAYAAEGYQFQGWYNCTQLISTSPTYELKNINSDYHIFAVFEKPGAKTFNMASSAGAGGMITPAGTYPVPQGTNVTYVMTPNNGYYLSSLKVDGKSVTVTNAYTFQNVSNNHSIVAGFTKKPDPQPTPQPTPKPADNTGKKTDDSSQKKTESAATEANGESLDEAKETLSEIASDPDAVEALAVELREAEQNTNYDQLTGVLQEYNMTPNEAYLHLFDEIGDQMFSTARDMGYIIPVVNNDYETGREYAERKASLQPLFNATMTDEEALGALEGKQLEIHIDITNTTGATPQSDLDAISALAASNKLAIDNTFDITILKTYEGVTSHISDLGKTVPITLEVPVSLRRTGATYKVLHVHEGEAELLEDMDDNPNTVTFMVSRFSTFAMAYETTNEADYGKVTGSNVKLIVDTLNQTEDGSEGAVTGRHSNRTLIIIILAAVIVVCAIIVVLIIVNNGKKRKEHPRPNGHDRR